jgi:PAS domain S-box-containing protein
MDKGHKDPATQPQRKQPMVLDPARLCAVFDSGLLDSPADPLFDELCTLAAETAETPIALVTVLDDRRQFFKARIGLQATETPVEWSFCQHALSNPDQVLTVPDALLDDRFRYSPLVTGEPHIRAYMGAPLVDQQGAAFGTLCVIDRRPRAFSDALAQRMTRMAKLVSALIDREEAMRQTLKATQQQAEKDIGQLVSMLTHGLDVQAYVDTSGIYRYVNTAFTQAFQCEAADLVGRHVMQVTGEADYDQWIRQPLEDALAGRSTRYRRLAYYPARGDRWIDVELLPVRDGDGPIKGVVLRSRDVHDIVVAQTTIEQRLISQAQFINALAHDVREPLRTINGFVSLTLVEGADALTDDLRSFLQQALRSGKRLSILINDLLEFLKADGQKIRTEPVLLNELCASVLEDVGGLIKEHRVIVAQHGLNQAVDGAPVWLRLYLQNLIVNGIKYARPGVPPELTIEAQRQSDRLLLTVRDNGLGIAPGDIDKLFRPFVRLARTNSIPGTGLGLALCQKVAELHGTRIQVESVTGVGSAFSIALPVPETV